MTRRSHHAHQAISVVDEAWSTVSRLRTKFLQAIAFSVKLNVFAEIPLDAAYRAQQKGAGLHHRTTLPMDVGMQDCLWNARIAPLRGGVVVLGGGVASIWLLFAWLVRPGGNRQVLRGTRRPARWS